jgi:hypothetical protein
VTSCDHYRVEMLDRGRATSVCTCGWRSEPVFSAGLAGAAWDAHVQARLRPAGPVPPR